MKTTSVSLLERLRAVKPEESDWQRLQNIYLPLIRRWLGRVPGLGYDADDLAQEVLIVIVREIPQFQRQRVGSFRAWLRLVTVNRLRTHRKRRQRRRPSVGLDAVDQFVEQLADSNGDLARQWDAEHDRHVFENLLSIVRPHFGTKTWRAFERFALEGIPAAQVADEVGVTENAVLQAKSRILKRLNSLDAEFCVEALDEALEHGRPEIFNTDQGAQFTSARFTERLLLESIAISMDGRGRALDNVFIERLWRSVKYEDIYLKEYASGADCQKGLRSYFTFYCHERPHQSLDYRTPWEVHSSHRSASR